jgi:cytochrome c peroxidase
METSIGHRRQRGPRNAPTVLNAVFNTAQFWDSRAKALQEQAGGRWLIRLRWGRP